jgi:hypothetical protein
VILNISFSDIRPVKRTFDAKSGSPRNRLSANGLKRIRRLGVRLPVPGFGHHASNLVALDRMLFRRDV